MSINSNLHLARKYEWNSMMAKMQNDTFESNRYESMAKMAMIDAGIDYSDINTDISANNNTYNNSTNGWDCMNTNQKLICGVSTLITLLLFFGLYLFVKTL